MVIIGYCGVRKVRLLLLVGLARRKNLFDVFLCFSAFLVGWPELRLKA